MANQPMIKVTLPDGKGGFTVYEAPASSEMEIREVFAASLTPQEQTKIRITPILSGEENMRIQIEEQNEIARQAAEIAELKAQLAAKKPKQKPNE